MAKLPTVVSNLAPDLRAFVNRVREAIDGKGGNRLVSVDDLINGGVVVPGPGGTIVPPGSGVVGPPPAPQNLTATGSVFSIFVEWDDPRYFGHAYAEVWGGETNNLGDAVLLGMAPGVNYVDAVPPSTSRYYWVRFVNILDEAGPYNAVSGTLGQTQPDVDYLLDTLTNSIRESQLYQDLGARINLIDGPISLAGSVAARIYAEEQARLAADTLLGSSITSVQNTNNTQATQITSLQTRTTTAESNIINLQSTTASQATSITSLTTRTGTAESNITNLQSTTASQATAITNLTTRTTNAESNITSLQTTTANQATSISQLSTSVGANTTAIEQEATTRINADNSIFSKYSVKIDTNGYVSGFGLISTANNATPFSDFIIRADRFSIAAPSGPGITPLVPFTVVTTPQVIDGTTVPTGVYIDGAFIRGGSIQGSAIVNGTITGTKLIDVSANKITGAALLSTSFIESAGYIAGSQGWKINGNGTAEFAAASIRGTLTAAQINSNGLSIRDTSGNIILNAGTGNFTGSLNGTAASTVVSNASTALATANTANSTATTANATANSALAGLSNKISNDARNVLSGGGGIAIGSLNWDSTGNRTSGFGIGITRAGIAAFRSNGTSSFVLNGTTGDASFGGDITAGTIGGSNVGTTFVRSANYSAGLAGWEIDSNGDAEFNQLTVRSGQVTGALLRSVNVALYRGKFAAVYALNPATFEDGWGPYYFNNSGPPHYLVAILQMPAPETAAHRIASVFTLEASSGGANKDLAIRVIANCGISAWDPNTERGFFVGDEVTNATSSGVFGMSVTAAGASSATYQTQVNVCVWAFGFNMEYTVGAVRGLMFGIR